MIWPQSPSFRAVSFLSDLAQNRSSKHGKNHDARDHKGNNPVGPASTFHSLRAHVPFLQPFAVQNYSTFACAVQMNCGAKRRKQKAEENRSDSPPQHTDSVRITKLTGASCVSAACLVRCPCLPPADRKLNNWLPHPRQRERFSWHRDFRSLCAVCCKRIQWG